MTTAPHLDVVDDELVLDLGCVDAQLLPVVGGKAANLGELIRAGFPVPAGFCITTAAYQQAAAAAFDGGAPPAGPHEKLAERARAAILAPADRVLHIGVGVRLGGHRPGGRTGGVCGCRAAAVRRYHACPA